MSRRKLVRLLVMAVAVAESAPTWSQQGDFVVVETTVNPVMQPKTFDDAFQECVNNSACRTLAEGAATYLGVPPGSIAGAAAIIPQAARKGEEGYFSIALPPGYQYCRSKIMTTSVVPATGDRASFMGATAQKNTVEVYTWTPERNPLEGRSWIEARYTVYGVRDELAGQARTEGKCFSNENRLLIRCRGASGINKDTPSCQTFEDAGKTLGQL